MTNRVMLFINGGKLVVVPSLHELVLRIVGSLAGENNLGILIQQTVREKFQR